MPTLDLFSYLTEVQARAGLLVSSSFPSSPSDDEKNVLYGINNRLRYLNNKYYLTFQQTEYTLTTTSGVSAYNLTESPYNQTFWRNYRTARNGLRRGSDDYPLTWIDYTEQDALRPSSSVDGQPYYYSAFGQDILIYPPANASVIKIRYYGTHIGTDAAGTVQKLKLTESDDLPMLEDEWQDVLITGAAMVARQQFQTDERYAELKREFEEWENILVDMANQSGGEDAPPQMVLQPYIYRGSSADSRYYPFFTDHE